VEDFGGEGILGIAVLMHVLHGGVICLWLFVVLFVGGSIMVRRG
jgi:hypothetical protein